MTTTGTPATVNIPELGRSYTHPVNNLDLVIPTGDFTYSEIIETLVSLEVGSLGSAVIAGEVTLEDGDGNPITPGSTTDFVTVATTQTVTGSKTFSSSMQIGEGSLGSGYLLSIQDQDNDGFAYIEILSDRVGSSFGGAGRGAFFGMEDWGNNLVDQEFAQYNWQGGPIVFWTDTAPSSGIRRFQIENDGTLSIPGAQGGSPGTADYELLVLDDDDIPNRKFVTDYVAANGDNLGNHTATQDLDLANFDIVGANDISTNTGVSLTLLSNSQAATIISSNSPSFGLLTLNSLTNVISILNSDGTESTEIFMDLDNFTFDVDAQPKFNIGTNGANDGQITIYDNTGIGGDQLQLTSRPAGKFIVAQGSDRELNYVANPHLFSIQGNTATDTFTVSNFDPQDLFRIEGDGRIRALFPAYEILVDADNVLTNRKYVDDAIAAAPGDNLGNHTATQALDMAGFPIQNLNTVTNTTSTAFILTANEANAQFTSTDGTNTATLVLTEATPSATLAIISPSATNGLITDFTGHNFIIAGSSDLKINSNAGVAGQVILGAGAGSPPVWANFNTFLDDFFTIDAPSASADLEFGYFTDITPNCYGIRQTGLSGYFCYMPNADNPQLVLGSPTMTGSTFIDSENSADLFINQLNTGAGVSGNVTIGAGGLTAGSNDATFPNLTLTSVTGGTFWNIYVGSPGNFDNWLRFSAVGSGNLNEAVLLPSGAWRVQDGSAGEPSHGFLNFSNYGMFMNSSYLGGSALGLSTAGIARFYVRNTGELNVPAFGEGGVVSDSQGNLSIRPYPDRQSDQSLAQQTINFLAGGGTGTAYQALNDSSLTANNAIAQDYIVTANFSSRVTNNNNRTLQFAIFVDGIETITFEATRYDQANDDKSITIRWELFGVVNGTVIDWRVRNINASADWQLNRRNFTLEQLSFN